MWEPDIPIGYSVPTKQLCRRCIHVAVRYVFMNFIISLLC